MRNLLIKAMPLTFVFLWSTGFIGAKLGLPYIEAYSFLSIRIVFVLAILLALIAIARVRIVDEFENIIHAMISGGLMSGIYLLGAFSAIQFGLSAGLTALIVSMQPILTALIVRRIYHERLDPKQWLGIAIAFLGVCMVLSRKILAVELEDSLSYQGLGFAVFALVAITVGSIYQKSHKGDMDLRTVTFWQNIGALIIIAPCALLFDSGEIIWDIELVFALSWLVIILSIVTMFLLLMLIKAQSANQVASLFF